MKREINQKINVGVDTGKFQLDIYFTVLNYEDGIKKAVKTIKKHLPERVVIEVTERLEIPFYTWR